MRNKLIIAIFLFIMATTTFVFGVFSLSAVNTVEPQGSISYVAYKARKYSNSTYTYYTSIQAAIDSSVDGDAIEVIRSHAISTPITVAKKITLMASDGLTVSLTRNTGFYGNMLQVLSGGELNMGSSSSGYTGLLTFDGENKQLGEYGQPLIQTQNVLKIYDGIQLLNNFAPNKALAVNVASGSFYLYGGLISNNKSNNFENNGVVYLNNGTSGYFNGGSIFVPDNTIKQYAIYSENASVDITATNVYSQTGYNAVKVDGTLSETRTNFYIRSSAYVEGADIVKTYLNINGAQITKSVNLENHSSFDVFSGGGDFDIITSTNLSLTGSNVHLLGGTVGDIYLNGNNSLQIEGNSVVDNIYLAIGRRISVVGDITSEQPLQIIPSDYTLGRVIAVYSAGLTPNIDNFALFDAETNGAELIVVGQEIRIGTTEEFDITLSENTYVYDGQTKTPSVTVKISGSTLTENVDYVVSGDTSATNVGSYTITITGLSNYINHEQSVSWSITPNPAQLEVTLTQSSFIYSGEVITPFISQVKAGSIILTASDYEIVTASSTLSATNKGDYVISIRGIGNYSGTGTAEWHITALEITSVTFTDVTYNGVSQTPVIATITPSGATYALSPSNYSQTNAGTYTVTVVGTGNYSGEVTNSWTINTKGLTGTWGLANSWTYDGASHGPTFTGWTGVVATDSADISYTLTDETAINVGDYTAYAQISGTKKDNYHIVDGGSKEYHITAQSLTAVTFTATTYNSEIQTPVVSSITPSGALSTNSYEFVGTYQYENAGTYTITIRGTGNYQGEVQANWVIEKANTIVISWSNTTLIYTGSLQGPTAVVASGVISGDSVGVSVSGQQSAVGTFTATATLNGTHKDNYSISSGETTQFTIGTKALTLSWGSLSLVYNGTAQKPTVSVLNGVIGSEVVNVSVSDSYLKTDVGGPYTAIATLGGTNAGNYHITSGDETKSFYITQKGITINWTPSGTAEFVYNGNAQGPTPALSGIETIDNTAEKVALSITNGTAINVGSYTASVSLTGTRAFNYSISNGETKPYSITSANLEGVIIFEDETYSYNATNRAIEPQGMPEGVSVTYLTTVKEYNPDGSDLVKADSTSNSFKEAGVYYITASFDGGDNYEDLVLHATLTINRATISIKADDKTSVYGESLATLTWSVSSGQIFSGDSTSFDGIMHLSTTATSESNVTTYPISISTDGHKNYAITTVAGTYTITKATLTGITFDDDTVTYDSQEHYIEPLASSLPSGVSVSSYSTISKEYKAQVSDAYEEFTTVLLNKFTNAGQYTITAYINGGTNYENTTKTATLQINRKQVTYYAEDKTSVYGETPVALTFALDIASTVYAGDVTSVQATLHLSCSVTSSSPVDDYDITLSTDGHKNYDITVENGTYTITKATITGITFVDKTETYDNTQKTINITGTLPSGTSVSYQTTSAQEYNASGTLVSVTAGTNIYTEAGVYAVSALISGSNYNDLTLNATLTIDRREVTYTADDKNTAYGATVATLTYTLTSGTVITGQESSVTQTLSINTNPTVTTSSVVGNYTIVLSSSGHKNYNITTINGTYTVGKQNITGVTFEDKTETYNGSQFSIVPTTLPSGTSIRVTDPYITQAKENNADGSAPASATTVNSNAFINAGTYVITVYIDGGTNYNDASFSATLTINRAIPTLTFAQSSVTVTAGNSVTNIATPTPITGGVVSYSSADTGVATVNSSGVVTAQLNYTNISTTINATLAGTKNYTSQTASYTLTIEEAVAQVGSTYYTSISSAVQDASADETIIVLKSHTISSATILINKNLTILSNANVTVTSAEAINTALFRITAGNVIFGGGSGVLEFDGVDATSGNGAINIELTATITIAGQITFTNFYGGVFNMNANITTGGLSINGGTFSNNRSSNGGVILRNGGSLFIGNATFTNNQASNYGGVIYQDTTDNSIVYIEYSTFSENEATLSGGVIYNASLKFGLDIAGAYINDNIAGASGGAIFTSLDSATAIINVHIDGSDILGNRSNGSGAGLYISNTSATESNVSISGTNIESHIVSGEGTIYGGVIYTNYVDLSIDGCYIDYNYINSDNELIVNGGIIYASNSAVEIITSTSFDHSCIVQGENVQVNGGAVYLSNVMLSLDEAYFYNHIVTGNGGALYMSNTTGTIGNVYFDGNQAYNGGALYINNASSIALKYTSEYYNNSSENDGSVIYSNNSSLTMTDIWGIFQNNTATRYATLYSTGSKLSFTQATVDDYIDFSGNTSFDASDIYTSSLQDSVINMGGNVNIAGYLYINLANNFVNVTAEMLNTKAIKLGLNSEHYTIGRKIVDFGELNVQANKFVLTGNASYELITIEKTLVIGSAEPLVITNTSGALYYDGTDKYPTLLVTVGGVVLEEDATDGYEIVYEGEYVSVTSAVNVGSYYIYIRGLGNYNNKNNLSTPFQWTILAESVVITLNAGIDSQGTTTGNWVWASNAYTQTLSANGSNTLGSLPIPTKANYVFAGWETIDHVTVDENTIIPIVDTTYYATWNDAVAKNDTTGVYYETLEGAISAVSADNNVILILRDTTVISQMTISYNMTIKSPDGVSPKITRGDNATFNTKSMFTISSGKTLIFGGGTGVVTIDGNNISISTWGGVFAISGSLTISSGTFTNNKATSGGVIAAWGESTVIINNGDFTNNASTTGDGGVIASDFAGLISITGGNFTNNTAELDGGVINNYRTRIVAGNGGLKISGGTFKGNSAGRNGGVVYNDAYTDEITGGTFGGTGVGEGNKAPFGGVIFQSGGTLTISNALFVGNSSINVIEIGGNQGGVIYNQGAITISSGTFKSNGVVNNNGGVIYNEGTLTISDGTFGGTLLGEANTASNGAVIYNAVSSVCNINGGNFINNSSYNGNVVFNNRGSVTISNGTFKGNVTSGDGGVIDNVAGISTEYSTLIVTGGIFGGSGVGEGNKAYNGGVICNGSFGQVTISNAEFIGNQAISGDGDGAGGAIYNWGNSVVINSGTFSSNSTDNAGGAIYNAGTILTIKNGTFNDNSSTNIAGAVFNESTLVIENGTFTDNFSNSHGGVIYNGGTITIDNGIFNANTSEYLGGVLYNDGTATINNGVFKSNSAAGGGVIHNTVDGTLSITGGQFGGTSEGEGNRAYEMCGGAIDTDGVFSLITGTGKSIRFYGNYAYEIGDDIYSDSDFNIGGNVENNGEFITGTIFVTATLTNTNPIIVTRWPSLTNPVVTFNTTFQDNKFVNSTEYQLFRIDNSLYCVEAMSYFTVEYYYQNTDGTMPSEVADQNDINVFYAETGAEITDSMIAKYDDPAGEDQAIKRTHQFKFIFDEIEIVNSDGIVTPNNATLVKMYYVRDIHVLTLEGEPIDAFTSVSLSSDGIVSQTGNVYNIRYGSNIELFYVIDNEDAYSFDRWSSDTFVSGGINDIPAINFMNMPIVDVLVKALVTPNTYNLLFNGNGGTTSGETRERYYNQALGKLPDAEKIGSTFLGWFDQTLTTEYYSDSAMPDHNLVLYAKWQVINYTLTFNPNGGTVSPTSMSVTYGQILSGLPTPVKSGYDFAGWYGLGVGWDGSSAGASFAGGAGTQESPYEINNASQLKYLANLINNTATTANYNTKYYKLTAHIDLGACANWNPIGNNATSFKGYFDGNGYQIHNLKINSTTTGYVGLFGHLTGASINNVVLSNVHIEINNPTYALHLGSVVGYATTSNITNCQVLNSNSSIMVTSAKNINVGGIIGDVPSASSSAYSYYNFINYASINVTQSGTTSTTYIGGIAGAYARVENVINYGNINANSPNVSDNSTCVGGITGYRGLAIYAWNLGYIDVYASNVNVGGIVAFCDVIGDMFNIINEGDIYVETNSGSSKTAFNIGGVAGKTQNISYVNVYNFASIEIKTNSAPTADSRIGGVAGYVNLTTTVNSGIVANNGQITITINGTPGENGPKYVNAGGVFGEFGNSGGYESVIENVYNTANITISTASAKVNAGGVFGKLFCTANYTYNIGNINITSLQSYVGGIVGQSNNSNAKVYYSFNIGSVTAITTNATLYSDAGGISGYKGTVNYSYNIGAVVARGNADQTFADAIVNVGTSGSCSNCYYKNSVTVIEDGVENEDWVNANGTYNGSLSTTTFKTPETFSQTNFVWNSDTWDIINGSYPTLSSLDSSYPDVVQATIATFTSYTSDIQYSNGSAYNYTGNLTLTADWTSSTYTISYELNGGSWASGYTSYPTSYTVESSEVILPTVENVVLANYVFAGWYDNSGLTGSAITSIPTGSTSGNKTFYAKWDSAVAKNDTTGIYYKTLESAISAVVADNNIILLIANTTVSSQMTINYNMTIKANTAYTITRNAGFTTSMFVINTGKTLTFGGGTATLKVDGAGIEVTTAGAVFSNSGTLNIQTNSTFTRNYSVATTNDMGAGVVYNTGTLNVTGGIFGGSAPNANHSYTNGGVIVNNGGQVAISGSPSFTYNYTTSGHGSGGVLLSTGATATTTISGTPTFSYNTATNGGAIVTTGGASITISSGTFTYNSASINAGALQLNGSSTISGGTYTNNTATTGIAGAIRVPSAGTLTLSGGIFNNNSAFKNGGAMYNENILNISGNPSFSGNTQSDGSLTSDIFLTSGKKVYVNSALSSTGIKLTPASFAVAAVMVTYSTELTPSLSNFTLVGNANYELVLAPTTYDLVIGLTADMALTIGGTFTYNGSSQTPSSLTVQIGSTTIYPYNASTNPNGYVILNEAGKVSVTSATNVGTYTIYVRGTGAYSNRETSQTWTINPKAMTFAVTKDPTTNYTYDGTSKGVPTITVKDGSTTLVDGTHYTLSGTGTSAQTNAGTYTISVTGTGNYAGSTGSITWTINPKVMTFDVTLSQDTYTYTGLSQGAPTVTVQDGSTLLHITTDYTLSGTGTSAQTNAGTYSISVSGAGNYAGSTGSATWTINKSTQTITISTSDMTLVSGNTATRTYTISPTSGGGTVSVNSSNTDIATVTGTAGTLTVTGVSAGSATITVSMAENANYAETSKAFTVVVTGAVARNTAKIAGSQYYTSIALAVNAATAGNTILIVASHNITNAVTIDKNLTIKSSDGVNVTVTRGASFTSSMFTINSGKTLTFGGGTGVVTIDGDAIDLSVDGGVFVNHGTLNIVSGTFNNNRTTSNGGVIYNNDGQLTISGGSFTNNYAYSGGVIANMTGGIDDSEVNISGGSFMYSDATNGAVIFNTDTTGAVVNITGGSFEQGTATYGAVIFNESAGIIHIDDGNFESNYSTNGGVIYNSWGSLTIDGGQFNLNSGDIAGVIYNIDGSITISSGIFQGNSTTTNGGVIYNEGESTEYKGILTITGGTFGGTGTGEENKALYGAVIYNATYGEVTISNASFIGNLAINESEDDGYGGVIYNCGSVIINSGTFKGNKSYFGGVINNFGSSSDYATLTIAGGTFGGTVAGEGNNAEYGAVFECGSYSEINISSGSFINNLAYNPSYSTGDGGVIRISDITSTVTISGGTFKGNTGFEFGGVISNWAGTLTITGGTFGGTTGEGNSSSLGGAIYNESTLNISGNPTFTGNTQTNDSLTSDIYLASNKVYVPATLSSTGIKLTPATFTVGAVMVTYATGLTPSLTNFTLIGNANYKLMNPPTTQDLVIGAVADMSLALGGTPFTYNGSSQTPSSLTVQIGSTTINPYNASTNPNGYIVLNEAGKVSVTSATNAGTYTIYIRGTGAYSDKETSQTWQISAKSVVITLSAGAGSSGTTTGSWVWASNAFTQTLSATGTSTLGTLPSPTKTGYTFAGWETAGQVAISSSTIIPASNTTYYAKWTVNSYSISYAYAGGTAGTTNPTPKNYDSSFYVSAPTKTGYTFAGWTLAGTNPNYSTAKYGVSSGTITTAISSSSVKAIGSSSTADTYFINLSFVSGGAVTLTANWTPNIYQVTLDNQSATTAGTTAYWYFYNTVIGGVYYYTDAECTIELINTTITLPTKTGYTFGGYFTSTNGQGTQYINASGLCINNIYNSVADNSTLYAKWTLTNYTITYNLNGGSWASGYTAPSSYNIESSLVTLPTSTDITKENCIFAGWYDNSGLTGSVITSISTGSSGNKEYWVKWTVAVAKNSRTGVLYETLSSAITNAIAEDTILIVTSHTLTTGLTIDKNLTIMAPTGVNVTITRGASNYLTFFTISSGKTLTFGGGTGVITIDGASVTASSGGAVFNNSGTLYLVSGTFINNISYQNGGVIYNNGTLNISGGTFTNNSATTGNVIYSSQNISMSGTVKFSSATQTIYLSNSANAINVPSTLTLASGSVAIPVLKVNSLTGVDNEQYVQVVLFTTYQTNATSIFTVTDTTNFALYRYDLTLCLRHKNHNTLRAYSLNDITTSYLHTSLANAISAQSGSAVLYTIIANQEISATVTIASSFTPIYSYENVTITRASGFNDSMIIVPATYQLNIKGNGDSIITFDGAELSASTHGGVVNNSGTLSIENVDMKNNYMSDHTPTTDKGPAIYSTGSLSVKNSSFSNNKLTVSSGPRPPFTVTTYLYDIYTEGTPSYLSLSGTLSIVGIYNYSTTALTVYSTAVISNAIEIKGNESDTTPIITFGYTEANPYSKFVAVDGYTLYKKSGEANNLYFGQAIAQIQNGLAYPSISMAVTNAIAGDTILVLASHTITSAITIDKNLTIKAPTGVNVTVTRGASFTSSMFTIGSGKTLTFGGGTGVVTIDGNNVYSSDGSVFNSAGTLTINSGIFENNIADAGAVIANSGSLTINNGTFSSNTADEYYGGVLLNSGTVTLNAGTFDGNSASISGGVFWNTADGQITIISGTFSNNTGTDTGAVVYNLGTLTISGGTFTDNSSNFDAGVIFNDSGTVSISSGTFKGNSTGANYAGGVIYNSGISGDLGTVNITGGTFGGTVTGEANSATYGGVIYNGSYGEINISNAQFVGNTASEEGGVIYNLSTLTIISGTFSNNTSTSHGGVVYHASGTLTITNGTFSSNYTDYKGAVVYNNATLAINSGTFKSNSAAHSGGVVCNTASGTVTVTGGIFGGTGEGEGNIASDVSGGAIDNGSGGTISLVAGSGKTIEFYNNSADEIGDDIYSTVGFNIGGDVENNGEFIVSGSLTVTATLTNTNAIKISSPTDGTPAVIFTTYQEGKFVSSNTDYTLFKDGNNLYMRPVNAVARVGLVYYTNDEFQSAISAVSTNNGVVYLVGNVTISTTINLSRISYLSTALYYIKPEGADRTITRASGFTGDMFNLEYINPMFLVDMYQSKVTFGDSTNTYTLTFNGNYVSTSTGSVIAKNGSATMTLEGKIDSSNNYYRIISANLGTLNINSTGTLATTNSALYVSSSATVNISNATLSGSHAIYHSGTGTVTITSGTMQSAGTGNSVIYNYSTGTISVISGTVERTVTGGDGIYNNSTGAIYISGSAVVDGGDYGIYNYSTGMIYLKDSPTIYGTRFGIYLNVVSTTTPYIALSADYTASYTLTIQHGLSGNNYQIFYNDYDLKILNRSTYTFSPTIQVFDTTVGEGNEVSQYGFVYSNSWASFTAVSWVSNVYSVTSYSCFSSDTYITVWDEKRKRLRRKKAKDIKYTDKILVWNFDKGCFDFANPLTIQREDKAMTYYEIYFSDGSMLEIVNDHAIFNVDKNMFTPMVSDDKNYGSPVGTRVMNDKGEIVTIISKRKIEKQITYTNIFTVFHLNLYANGILTSTPFNNMYPIKDMKFIPDDRQCHMKSLLDGINDEWRQGMRLDIIPDNILLAGLRNFPDCKTFADYVNNKISMQKPKD